MLSFIFTARRFASAVCAVIVCLSVCLSVRHTPVLYHKKLTQRDCVTLYDSKFMQVLRGMTVRKVSNSKSDLQGHIIIIMFQKRCKIGT